MLRRLVVWPTSLPKGFLRLASSMASKTPEAVNLVLRYEEMAKRGVLQPDPNQLACLERLQFLLEELQHYGTAVEAYESAMRKYRTQLESALPHVRQTIESRDAEQKERREHFGGRWFAWTAPTTVAGGASSESDQEEVAKLIDEKLYEILGDAPTAPSPPIGVYLHGEVGTGKTMLANMLYTAAAEGKVLPFQRRVHSNAALLELHSRMHQIDQAEKASARGAVGDAASQQAKQARKARIALRRLVRERSQSSQQELKRALGSANSSIMLEAAKALLTGTNSQNQDQRQQHSRLQEHTTTASAGPALLCLDEMQTTDPYNVAALKALTEATLGDGGVIIATSNRAPRQLTRHGLHEDMFDHLVATLEEGCDVMELRSGIDYRRRAVQFARDKKKRRTASEFNEEVKSSGDIINNQNCTSYFCPLGPGARAAMEAAWADTCASSLKQNQSASQEGPLSFSVHAEESRIVPVMFGREIEVHRHFAESAWFTFEELCARPLGPADYMALASTFDTIFIEGVPAMSMRVRDKARRFITLVDELYNSGSRLVCSAEVDIDDLFAAVGTEGTEEPLVIDLEGLQFEGAVEGAKLRRDVGAVGGVAPVELTQGRVDGLGGTEEAFAFARAVSRLHEMQSPAYGRALQRHGEDG